MAQDKKHEQVKVGTKRFLNGVDETLMELDQELNETGEIEGAEERITDLIDELKYYKSL